MATCTIVGGGIGGLTAALCLAAKGWQVEVLEQADAFSDVGAGIQLSPNAMAVYRALDPVLFQNVLTHAVAPTALMMRDGRSGRDVFLVPLADPPASASGSDGRWGAPYVNIYRPLLIDSLCAAIDRHKQIRPHFGSHVDGALFERLKRTRDLVVVANGLHSDIVQEHFYAAPPTPSGHIAYRAVVPGFQAIPQASCAHVGSDRHAVTYPIMTPDGLAANFVGIREASDSEIQAISKGWATDNVKEHASRAFDRFAPLVRDVISAADVVRPWALFHREPLPTWHSRNAVLLGDAAHPMMPTFAQGAAMAIEDAWVLARELSGPHSQNNALSRYTGFRLPRVKAVYDQAMRNLHLFHQKGWFNRRLGSLAPGIVARIAPGLILSRFDSVYGHNVTELT